LLGLQQLLWPLLTSGSPSRSLSTAVAHGRPPDLPGYCAPTFTLMPVGYTSQRAVQVSGFDDIGRLAPLPRLVSASCSSGQRFAFSFLQIPSRPGHPCRSANSSPCRVSKGLSPSSECALPGAHRVGGAVTRAVLPHHRTCGSASGGSCLLGITPPASFVPCACRLSANRHLRPPSGLPAPPV